MAVKLTKRQAASLGVEDVDAFNKNAVATEKKAADAAKFFAASVHGEDRVDPAKTDRDK